MSEPRLVSAPWTQGKYDGYTLDENGLFYGCMHPQGVAYEKNPDPNAPTDTQIKFFANRNAGSISGKWVPCGSLRSSYKDIPTGRFDCDFLLVRGVWWCPSTRKQFFVFRRWKGIALPLLL